MQIRTDEHFMNAALQEAKRAFAEDEIPVGAVVVCNEQVIARAHNMTERLNDVTAHAEMIALTAASNFLNSKYLLECTLYVTLEPCLMCAGALFWSQISTVVYAAPDEKRGCRLCRHPVLHPKTTVRSGVLETQSAQLLKEYFKAKR